MPFDLSRFSQFVQDPKVQQYLRSAGMGAAMGGGAMGLHDMLTNDEDQGNDKLKSALRSALLGASLGGVAGTGIQAGSNFMNEAKEPITRHSIAERPPIADNRISDAYFTGRDLLDNPAANAAGAGALSLYRSNSSGAADKMKDAVKELNTDKANPLSSIFDDAKAGLPAVKGAVKPSVSGRRNAIMDKLFSSGAVNPGDISAGRGVINRAATANGGLTPELVDHIRTRMGLTGNTDEIQKELATKMMGPAGNQATRLSKAYTGARNTLVGAGNRLKEQFPDQAKALGQLPPAIARKVTGYPWSQGGAVKDKIVELGDRFGKAIGDRPESARINSGQMDPVIDAYGKPPGFFTSSAKNSPDVIYRNMQAPNTLNRQLVDEAHPPMLGRAGNKALRHGLYAGAATMALDPILDRSLDKMMLNPAYKQWMNNMTTQPGAGQ